MQKNVSQKNSPGRLRILRELSAKIRGDLAFRSGRILGSMCTRPHKLAVRVFTRHIEKNIGDTGLSRATKQLEEETVRSLGRLLHAEDAGGYIVTGGTEANILAMWTARNRARDRGNEVVVPASAHFSFDKAADLLGLKLIRVPLDSGFRMDLAALKQALGPRTIAIVAVAGSTPLGMIDPVREIAELAGSRDIYLHVDAAFGGYVLPFLGGGGDYPFDFALAGVCSITIDPHKMGLAPIPAGGILYRNRELAETVRIDVSYLSGGETRQSTIVATRSGASVIAVWTLLRYLGTRGYSRIVRQCLSLTRFLAAEIRKIDTLELMTEPVINVVGIRSGSIPVAELADELRQRGWAVALFEQHIRICVMPHLKKKHLVRFIRGLQTIVADRQPFIRVDKT